MCMSKENVEMVLDVNVLNQFADKNGKVNIIIEDESLRRLAVKKAIINDHQLIVLWNDGTKTITTCAKDDDFDAYVGIQSAFLKKIFGSETIHAKMERAMKKIEIQNPTKKKETPKTDNKKPVAKTVKKTTSKKK